MKQILFSQLLFVCIFWLGLQLAQSKVTFLSSVVSKGSNHHASSQAIGSLSIKLDKSCLPAELSIRGGSDEETESDEDESDDEEEADEDVDDSDDEEESSEVEEKIETGIDVSFVIDKVGTLSKKAAILVGKVAIQTAKAFQRGIQAAMHGEEIDDEDDAPTPMTVKVLKVVKRMIKAAFTFPTEGEKDDSEAMAETTTKKSKKKVSSAEDIDNEEEADSETAAKSDSSRHDFGTFLSTSYEASDERGDDGPMMLGGSLANALKAARAEARMLVVLIPSERPSKKGRGKKSKDQLAIESVLSSEAAKAANKRARKTEEGMGSFLFWGAKMGSSEATAAIKRLNVKTTSNSGDKRPILVVVYPGQVASSSGVKTVPKVVAQHHCSPPPTPALMAAWLDSLRKRYAKQYRVMQTELKEVQYFKDRKEGYKESMQSDVDRQKREKEEAAKKAAEEQAEKERLEAIETRRKELKDSLPDEPKSGDAKKVALRFADGRSAQRRFSADESLSTVFNWVDAMFEMEREKVILTTMNGKQTFTWDEDTNEKSLADVGLGKMTGFRVSEPKEDTEEDTASSGDE